MPEGDIDKLARLDAKRDRLIREQEMWARVRDYAESCAAAYSVELPRRRRSVVAGAVLNLLASLATVILPGLGLLASGLVERNAVGFLAAAACGPALLWTYETLRCWFVTVRLSGFRTMKHIPRMVRMMSRTRTWWPFWYYRYWPLMLTLPLAGLFLFTALEGADQRHIWFIIMPSFLSIAACMYLKFALPPAVLVLTSSTPGQISWALGIFCLMDPLRVLAMLDERRLGPAWEQETARFKLILRTRDESLWQETVRELMEAATFIVLDTAEPITPAVVHEANVLVSTELVHKTFFVSDKAGRYPLLHACAMDTERRAVFVSRAELPRILHALAHGRAPLPNRSPFVFAPRHFSDIGAESAAASASEA